MWDYTDKVMDHFNNPRNAGVLKDANGVGEVGSLACGDALKLYLRINPTTEVIEEASFQTFGCASAIASASALTELIKGKTLKEASKLTNNDIAHFLGGLPKQKMHCSVMGQEALEAAIADYRHEEVGGAGHKEDNVVCKCFWVEEKTIRDVVKNNGLKTVEEVINYTKAGGGCRSCVDKIQQILDEENGLIKPHVCDGSCRADSNAQKFTNLQRVKLISDTIKTQIAPTLRSDGGNIELVDINGNNVHVRLKGACSGCPAAKATLEDFVQTTLRNAVSEDINIVEEPQ